MISSNHPYYFLTKLFSEEDAQFEFSKYVYQADSLFDDREILTVAGAELTPEWIEAEIEALRPDQELALHSRVKIKNRTYHIPMIDFSMDGPIVDQSFDRLRYFLPRKVILSLAIFASGRSYHGYSTAILEPKEWIEFMGRLLLINKRNGPEVVDTRWIGHRLIGGYCSLRWTNNSGLYEGEPRRI